jgi:hypothetical protein
MTEIFIDPTKPDITIQVISQSLHAVGFEITVFAKDGMTVKESFTGSTQTSNPFIKALAKPPAKYKNCFLSGTFTVISADGSDFAYSLLFTILQANGAIMPRIKISGTTTGGHDTQIANYHIN